MSKVGINSVIGAAIVLFIALVVGIVIVFSPNKPIEPEYLNTDFVDELLGDGGAKGSSPVNGSTGSVNLGNEVTELTATPDDGYVFGYWQVNSNSSNNANLKLCADVVIRVDTYRVDEFTPIFVAESNVIDITSLEDSKLKTAITNNTTAGKIFNLTQDCVLSSSFAGLGTFKGILKGNGHKVMGVNINHTTDGTSTGIFTQLDGAVITGLEIASGSIASVRSNVGSIAGVMTNSLISRCASNISVSSTNTAGVVGGLVGSNSGTKSMIYCSEFGGSASGMYGSGIVGVDNNVVLYKNKYNGAISGLQTEIEWGVAEIKSGSYLRSAIWGSTTIQDPEYCSNISVTSVTFGSYADYSNVVSGISTASVNNLTNNPSLAAPTGPGTPGIYDDEYDGGLTYIDISANGDGSVGVYRVANGTNYNVYVLTAQPYTKIKFNSDSGGMFSHTLSLATIQFNDVVDTSSVTGLSDAFGACSNLTMLDLSGWDTSNVTNMRWMFSGCTKLTTIYVGENWNTAKVTESTSMFNNCTQLTGGNGTQYEPVYDSHTYARVDTASAPGLLTLKS